MKSRSATFPEALRGFALATGIFLLVILAALGAFIVTVFTSQQSEQALDFLGARAFQAARAGIEWGIYQTQVATDPATTTYLTNCQAASYASPTKQNIGPLSGDLSSFKVTVTCGTGGAFFDDGGNQVWVYAIEAISCTPYNASGDACPSTSPGAFYAERHLKITVTN